MFFLFKNFGGHQDEKMAAQNRKSMAAGLLFNGILCVLFALAIFSAPELLAYLVGAFFLLIGVSLLVSWWKLRK